jgi:hypothetical protein
MSFQVLYPYRVITVFSVDIRLSVVINIVISPRLSSLNYQSPAIIGMAT